MAAVAIPKLLWSLGNNSSSVMVIGISARSIHQITQVLCWQSSHCDFPCTVPQTIPIKDVMSCDIWQVTITPLMCRQQQQKALIPAYLGFSNRNGAPTPVNGTVPSLLIRLCLQETPMVSFWFYQNTHGDNLEEVKHCGSNISPCSALHGDTTETQHRAQMVQPNPRWRSIRDSLESADCRHEPITALFQEVQKALLGCSCDPEKSWTLQSWKEEISPIIMLWDIHFCPEVC